jgi:dethiobiotin synthetase
VDGVFVTGTGTEVGKTVVAGVIARTAADAGRRVTVFKPAISGLDVAAAEGVVPDHEHLRMAARSRQSDEEIAPYRFGPAVSPHLAAALEGVEVNAGRLRSAVASARDSGDFCVCEGVGGFLVPLRLDYLVRDFATELDLPVVIVASPGLGTINHTILTVESVRAAGLHVAAVVLTPWRAEPTEMERSNFESIEVLSAAAVHTLGDLDPGDPAAWPALTLAP